MSKSVLQHAIQERFLDQRYRLAGRLIDPVSGMLSWQNKREHLRRKELEVLALLASADCKPVTRDNFIAVVWQGNDSVGERGLTNTLFLLRRSLRDEDADQPLIRTIPRLGYQLAVSAELVGLADAQDNVLDHKLPEPTKADESRHESLMEPGTTVADCPGWRLVRRLEQSPESESWLAEPSEFGERDQGLRVFRFCRSEAQLQRLRREVTLLRYLTQSLSDRPDIVLIRDWQLEEPPYYLVCDYANAGNLQDFITSGRLSNEPEKRVALMQALAEALAAVHAHGVVHRQLSAQTVLVDQRDAGPQLLLSAFDLGALSDRSKLAPLNITAAGLTMDSEALGAESATAADVYALGGVLLQLALADAQAVPIPQFLEQIADDRLRTLIAKCFDALAARPSAAELATQLSGMATPYSQHPAMRKTIEAPAQAQDAAVQAAALPISPKKLGAQPTSIGNYRLLDRLGEGGMGTVYLAEQRDPYRKVALKIIRSGMDGKQVLSRFDAERQALAMMNHPNVASVHESGLAPDGRPFFAMEYIAGDDITTYCDTHHLDLPARIKLFLQVCDGVLHAHQKGVLHRDIKPSNLMVSGTPDNAGMVKVIDFGLAKSLHGRLAAHTLHTSFGAFIGTPVYSSPEHMSGAAAGVDTRSDIYSMGVVLYELLAGMTPIASASLENLEPERVREIVCKSKLPSMREQLQHTSEEKRIELAEHRAMKLDELPRFLEGDLSWVVGKCLERDPDDRYASVLELKKDLERWLEMRPVEARPTSGWYRFRKLVRRNRLVSILIAATVATILLTTSAAIMGYFRAERALEASRAAEAEATAAADFQVKQIDAIDPGAMGLTLRAQLIEAVQKRSTERGWEPAAITQGQQQLSTLLEGVNFTDLSLAQLDKHQFEPTLASITKDFKDQPLLQARLWQSLADSLVKLGRFEAAIEPQRLALEQRQRLLGNDDPLTLGSLRGRGLLSIRKGEFKDAEVDFRAVLAGTQRVMGANHAETLRSQLSLATVLLSQRRFKEAQKSAQEVLDRAGQLLGPDDPTSLNAKLVMGRLQMALKKHPEAELLLRQALDGNIRVHGNEHIDTLNALSAMTSLYTATARYSEAESLLMQMLARKRVSLGDNHPSTLETQQNLLSVLLTQNRWTEYEKIARPTLKAMERSLGPEHRNTMRVTFGLAYVLSRNGKVDESIDLLKRLQVLAQSGTFKEQALYYKDYLADALHIKGETNEAVNLGREVLQTRRQTLGDLHPETLYSMNSLASMVQAAGDLQGAETLLREAVVGLRKTLGTPHWRTLNTIDSLAELLQVQGRLDEALTLGQEVIRGATELAKTDRNFTNDIPIFQIHHARTLTELRRLDEAESLLSEAKIGLIQDPYPTRTTVQTLAEGYIELYMQRHKTQPELGFDVKARTWREKLDVLKRDPTRLVADILRDKST